MQVDEKTKKRFLKKIAPPDENGCIMWTAAKFGNGYGAFRDKTNVKHQMHAHRFSYLLHKGDIADGMYVLHKCDNQLCVAPEHLFLGTQKDNMIDMKQKNRHLPGSKNGWAKITEDDAKYIKLHTELSSYVVAKMFGICQQQASRIRRGERWAHVTI